MERCLIMKAMEANAAGELLPLFQLLGAYLLHNMFVLCLNMTVAMCCSTPVGHRCKASGGSTEIVRQ